MPARGNRRSLLERDRLKTRCTLGYYIRVLSENDILLPVEGLRETLASTGNRSMIEIKKGDPLNWLELLLRHSDGTEIAVIETNKVLPGQLGAEEIEEFLEELEEAKPRSAAAWLKERLQKVRIIYAFQIL